MRIYISHSSAMDYKKDLYEPLKNSSFFKNHEFIFPHEFLSETFKTKELFKSGNCDIVLAEVSMPSTGQGIELGWASDFGIKIICFFKTGSKFSSALKLVSEKFVEYKDSADFINHLKSKLS